MKLELFAHLFCAQRNGDRGELDQKVGAKRMWSEATVVAPIVCFFLATLVSFSGWGERIYARSRMKREFLDFDR
jgi:hypothetical protein